MGDEMMMMGMVVLIGGFLLLKGCDLGIDALCNLSIGGSLSTGTPAAVPPVTATTTDTTGGVAGTTDTSSMLPMSQVMQFIATQAVNDIDTNTYAAMTRQQKFSMQSFVLGHYYNWLSTIADYNGQSIKPLTGRALAKYSSMILDICQRTHIRLNPAADAMYRANLFAGTPMMGNTTANLARSRVIVA